MLQKLHFSEKNKIKYIQRTTYQPFHTKVWESLA